LIERDVVRCSQNAPPARRLIFYKRRFTSFLSPFFFFFFPAGHLSPILKISLPTPVRLFLADFRCFFQVWHGGLFLRCPSLPPLPLRTRCPLSPYEFCSFHAPMFSSFLFPVLGRGHHTLTNFSHMKPGDFFSVYTQFLLRIGLSRESITLYPLLLNPSNKVPRLKAEPSVLLPSFCTPMGESQGKDRFRRWIGVRASLARSSSIKLCRSWQATINIVFYQDSPRFLDTYHSSSLFPPPPFNPLDRCFGIFSAVIHINIPRTLSTIPLLTLSFPATFLQKVTTRITFSIDRTFSPGAPSSFSFGILSLMDRENGLDSRTFC